MHCGGFLHSPSLQPCKRCTMRYANAPATTSTVLTTTPCCSSRPRTYLHVVCDLVPQLARHAALIQREHHLVHLVHVLQCACRRALSIYGANSRHNGAQHCCIATKRAWPRALPCTRRLSQSACPFRTSCLTADTARMYAKMKPVRTIYLQTGGRRYGFVGGRRLAAGGGNGPGFPL